MTVTAVGEWQIQCSSQEEYDEQMIAVTEHPKVTEVTPFPATWLIHAQLLLTYEVLGS